MATVTTVPSLGLHFICLNGREMAHFARVLHEYLNTDSTSEDRREVTELRDKLLKAQDRAT